MNDTPPGTYAEQLAAYGRPSALIKTLDNVEGLRAWRERQIIAWARNYMDGENASH